MKFLGWEFGETEAQARERFKTLKWRIVEATVVSFAMSIAGLLIVWQEWFAPQHLKVGLALYVLSYVPYVYKVYLTRQTWIEYKTYDWAYAFLKRQKYFFIALTIVIAAAFVYFYFGL